LLELGARAVVVVVAAAVVVVGGSTSDTRRAMDVDNIRLFGSMKLHVDERCATTRQRQKQSPRSMLM